VKQFTILLLIIFFSLPDSRAQGKARDEFNGPYASWADVKKRFGAKGDGRTDDTRAIQTAIDSLSVPDKNFNTGNRKYMVVYLPAGSYCISSTLVLRGKIGVMLVGQDPTTTTLKWTGPDKDTILWSDASAYFKISRISWDANGRKEMEGIGIHWKNIWNNSVSKSFATLNIELSDNYFIGPFRCGISGGTYSNEGTGANDSEIAIKRCTFNSCTYAGIEIHGFNALDYWIWDCRFVNCNAGVGNHYGNYHVYRSYFSGCSSDVYNNNGYYTSVRGCWSENCKTFSYDDGASCNPFKRIFQDNTVIDPREQPIRYYHRGKLTFIGNRFTRSKDTSVKNFVSTGGWCGGDFGALSLYNSYGDKTPIKLDVAMRLYASGDQYSGAPVQGRAAFLSNMDPLPPLRNRKVLEVPVGSDADAIQSILDMAASLKGQRPVVHFPMGLYWLKRTLVIPAGSDMQLIGDGLLGASVFAPDPTQTVPVLLLVKGPSYITIKDLQFGKDGVKGIQTAIRFEDADQPGAQAHLDQLYSHADTSLCVSGMDYLYVQKDNSFFTDGNLISGGPLLRKNELSATARVCCYGGQFKGLHVLNNGWFVAKDCWWEGPGKLPLELSGAGTITIDGAMIAPNKQDSTNTITIGKFNGSINLMNMYLQGALSPQADNPNLKLLLWNILFYYKMDPLSFLKRGGSYTGAFLGLHAQCFKPNDPECKAILNIKDRLSNISDSTGFLTAQIQQDRFSRPVLFSELPSGRTNVYLSRVSFGSMTEAVSFK